MKLSLNQKIYFKGYLYKKIHINQKYLDDFREVSHFLIMLYGPKNYARILKGL